jgi:hypothetical protein
MKIVKTIMLMLVTAVVAILIYREVVKPHVYEPRTILLHGGDTIKFAPDDISKTGANVPSTVVGFVTPLIYFDGDKMTIACGKYNDAKNSELKYEDKDGTITCKRGATQ